MKQIIVDVLLKIVTSEFTKDLIKKGLKKLVESTDSGIDDALLNIMLDESVKSTLNELTEDKVKEIKEKYNIQ